MRAKRFICVILLFGPVAISLWAQPASDFESLLHQGFALHQQQKYSEALPVLQRAWKIQPRNYFANLLIGIDLVRTGAPAKAVGFLKAARQQRSHEEFPHEYLGEAHVALKQYADATQDYLTATKAVPDSSQAAVAMVDYSLARFAEISNQLRSTKKGLAAEHRLEALSHPLKDADRTKLLRRSVELDDSNAEAWSDLALAELAGGNREAAESDSQRALKLNSNCLAAGLVQARLNAERGDWNDAANRLNEVARRSPKTLAQAALTWPRALRPPAPVAGVTASFFACVQEGCGEENLLEKRSAKPNAGSRQIAFREQMWEVVSSGPSPYQDKTLQFERGIAFAHLGNCEQATPLLENGLTANPQNVDTLFFLSVCYAQLAGEVEKRFRRSNGESAVLHNMRGDVMLRLQANSTAAIAEYQAALADHPGDPRTLEHLAEAQFAASQNDAARASAQAALKADEHRFSAQRTLTKIAMQDRDYETALPLLRALSQRDPRDQAVKVDLATACSQTGASAEALENLTLALKAGYPDEKGTLHYLLGTILRDLNRDAESKAAFATARQLSDSYQQLSRGDHDAK
jgi:tetratricopeptide (TPR) repeat protein